MKKVLLLAAAILTTITMTAATETIVFRVKGMRCEDCAHKVTTVLTKILGVENLNFDLEKRTVTVDYDAAQTCGDSIKARLDRTGRYKTSVYNENDIIRRGIGLQMGDMHCKNCADRIMNHLQTMAGIDSLAPHLDKQYMFIRYDANKTCKADIRQALQELGFTPVNYYTSKDISYAYFNIPQEACTEATIDEVLALDGVDDANVNPKRKSLAITYVNKDTSAEKLLQAIHGAGIEATVPPAHQCKENK